MTKHVSFAPFSFKVSKKPVFLSLKISFKDYVNYKSEIYEDDNLKVDKESIRSALNYLNFKGEDLTLRIPFKLGMSSKEVSSESDKDLIYTKRFSQEQLIHHFFSKATYPKEYQLKSYQSEGVNWLKQENGRLLADDMGLGKTMQAILAASDLIKNGTIKRVLVTCPRSLMHNWQSEISLWAPSLTSLLISGITEANKSWNATYLHSHFIITNYDHIRELPEILLNNPPDLLIADEAHKLRKRTSKINKALSELQNKRFWALTGTPIERDSNDLSTLLKLIVPNYSSNYLKKLDNFALKALGKKHTLRRHKNDVLKDLPDFNEATFYVKLTEVQEEAYERVRQKLLKNKKDILKYFGELISICNEHEGQSSKLDYIEELIEKILLHSEKVVIFSYSLSPLHNLKKRLDKNYSKNFSAVYEGGLDIDSRERIVNEFKEKKDMVCLLCSGKIASEGLTLTEANHVIFINEWWNPSSNKQAQDRVRRIGQKKKVTIYHLRSIGTVEERIDEILDGKVELTDEVVESFVRED